MPGTLENPFQPPENIFKGGKPPFGPGQTETIEGPGGPIEVAQYTPNEWQPIEEVGYGWLSQNPPGSPGGFGSNPFFGGYGGPSPFFGGGGGFSGSSQIETPQLHELSEPPEFNFESIFGIPLTYEPTQYQQDVLSGEYLDLESNPWLQEYTAALRNELNEEYQRTASQALSPFAAAGGTLGFSGISAGLQGIMADEHGENVANQLSSAYFNLYQSERQLQNEVSNQISNLQSTLYALAGGAYATQQSAWSAIESSKINANATLESATMSANASRFASELAYALGQEEIAAQLWFQFESLELAASELELQAQQIYAEMLLAYMNTFGAETFTTQQQDPFSEFFEGATGGFLTGSGATG